MSASGQPIVQTGALWLWDKTQSLPVVSGFPQGNGTFLPTKTGLQPNDLQQFVGVPLQYYGNPPTPVPPDQLLQWIRFAEDKIEQKTSLLLTQTWVASPPAITPGSVNGLGISLNTASGFQVRGYDYDLEDAAYDFQFPRAQEEGWMFLTLRYRPVQSVTYNQIPTSGNAGVQGFTAIKNTAFIYPLLNTYFKMPSTWNVEDRDYGFVRYVPATNVMMLPLFALQLSFMGFAQSVPGALWLQYTAGLTPFDYSNRYSFVKELVLCEAALTALSAIQGTINLGSEMTKTMVDGLAVEFHYPKGGPYSPLITRFETQRDALLKMTMNMVAGPTLNYW